MQKKSKKKNNKDDINKSLKSYAKYSGIAFQMAAIIFLGTWGGYKLDSYFGFSNHVLTLILSEYFLISSIKVYSLLFSFIP